MNFIPDLSPGAAAEVIESIKSQTRPEDLVDFLRALGGNWGYDIPEEQVRFAHKLIDSGAVDVVHGHSSHHVRPLEVYRGKLILYGAGDFLNDYEGIEGNEGYRDDLALMYFPRSSRGLAAWPGSEWFRFKFSGSASAAALRRLTPRGSEMFSTARAASSERGFVSKMVASRSS